MCHNTHDASHPAAYGASNPQTGQNSMLVVVFVAHHCSYLMTLCILFKKSFQISIMMVILLLLKMPDIDWNYSSTYIIVKFKFAH